MTHSPASGVAAPVLPPLGPAVPQHTGRLFRWIGRTVLGIAGWRLTGQIPDLSKFVVIVAPHTSNWDFPVGLATKWAIGFRVTWLGKDSLFKPPLGWFMRSIGGMPVTRSSANALVERTAEAFKAADRMVLVLAPEGTRSKVGEWRSGFWHIARTADVPVLCAAIDWGAREVRFGPTLAVQPDDGAEVDIRRIKAEYRGVLGRNPSQQA